MTNPLHKVAERIGMKYDQLCNDWEDTDGTVKHPDNLRAYLLTGDRPMRIFELVLVPASSEGCALDGSPGAYCVSPYVLADWPILVRPTPAEAILACAEAI
jgi:hypothetical protein